MDFAHFGSGLALRGFSRLGSQVAVMDFAQFGSSLALRGFSRLGAQVSVMDFAQFGSSLSLRGFSRLGSNVAVMGMVSLGSSLALRGFSRLGAQVSVMDFTKFGSSLSLRGFSRMGSAVSVMSFAHFGSAISLRGFSRIGRAISVMDVAFLGSGLSVRGCAHLAKGFHTDQAALRQITTQEYDTLNAMYVDHHKLEFEVEGTNVMSLTKDGGEMHGTWIAENTISTSDRRLKRDIRPLRSRLAENAEEGDAPLWVLRQMRPVSFSFREGSDMKRTRFGFVAQELETVLPDIVRDVAKTSARKTLTGGRDLETFKAVAYQDIIALLTSVAQSQQQAGEALGARVASLESRLLSAQGPARADGTAPEAEPPRDDRGRTLRMEARVSMLEKLVKQQAGEIERLHQGLSEAKAGVAEARGFRQDLRDDLGRGLQCVGLRLMGQDCPLDGVAREEVFA
eukprot:TRINITY_DN7219_c0_g1_i11.p1 TRINITY_DN7219_c0_g1~~TRINITY_DN7219_c0_g1_i11.p1  ORF type:complete len:453 (+),score=100.25 TRINITY_DN7219_c0_g1_i11:224-1582(+)